MNTGIKAAMGVAAAVLLGIGLLQLAETPDTPARVYIPPEQITGRAADHDVVHALQDIVESPGAVGDAVFQTARPVVAEGGTVLSDGDMRAEAEALFLQLADTELSPLAQLNLQRSWDLATTPEAQAEVLARLRAAVAAR